MHKLQIGFPENVLFHQYEVTIMSLLLSEYCNMYLNEKIDIYTLLIKSIFHDFSEYKGTEIISQFKNYNEITKKMFAEIEANDEKELEEKLGTNIYNIIFNYKSDTEGYIAELADKISGIMKLWVEVAYFHNYVFIKTINAVYQGRFKSFLRIENIDKISNKSFFIELLRKCYIYIKENLLENDIEYSLKYFTKEDLEQFKEEINTLKSRPEIFLK